MNTKTKNKRLSKISFTNNQLSDFIALQKDAVLRPARDTTCTFTILRMHFNNLTFPTLLHYTLVYTLHNLESVKSSNYSF